MKYTKRFILCLCSFGLIISCDPPEERTGQDQFEEQMDSFSESMEEIDETMELIDFLNNELEEIETRVEKGELSREDANLLAEELNNTYQREIAKRSNLNPATKLPGWAKDLGLTEPVSMMLDRDYSRLTSVNNPEDGYNSIKLVYKGDYNYALSQAKKIAEGAGIPLSKEYADAFKNAEKYPSIKESIKGIAYMNYGPDTKDIEYKISVSVDEKGKLTLYVVNDEQRNAHLQRIDNSNN